MPSALIVGTSPKLMLGPNLTRRGWTATFPPSQLFAANTGRIHLGLGFIPSTVVGSPDQGFVLIPGSFIGDEKLWEQDKGVYRGEIWAVASIAGQLLWVDEEWVQGAETPPELPPELAPAGLSPEAALAQAAALSAGGGSSPELQALQAALSLPSEEGT